MPRKPTVTADGAVKAIEQADTPFVSTGELAEYFDVTRQAVRDQRERLAADPRIEVGAVSNNTVFYLASVPLNEVEDAQQTIEQNRREREAQSTAEPEESLESHAQDVAESQDETTTDLSRVERLAHPRILNSGVVFLLLGVVFLPTSIYMAIGGAVLPGSLMLALAVTCLFAGSGLVTVAAAAQWYLARPLKALLPGVSANGDVTKGV